MAITANEMAKRRWRGTTKKQRSDFMREAGKKQSTESRRKAQAASVAARLAKKAAKPPAAPKKRGRPRKNPSP